MVNFHKPLTALVCWNKLSNDW